MRISCDQLEIGYSTRLQNPITFSASRGELHAVVGPNGSGKTTLFNTVLGIIPPLAGHVSTDGKLGALFQDRALPINVPVDRWVQHLARLWNAPINRQLLERLQFSVDSTVIRRLSGGSAQKLAIYTALHHNPDVAILDEPTNNLDAPSRENLYDIINAMKNTGTSFLVSSHQANDIAALNAEVINFSNALQLEHSALVTFSGAVVINELPDHIQGVQTATGLLLTSITKSDFMETALSLAEKNGVTITSFQVLS